MSSGLEHDETPVQLGLLLTRSRPTCAVPPRGRWRAGSTRLECSAARAEGVAPSKEGMRLADFSGPMARDRNPWVTLGLVMLGAFMTTLDTSIVNISLPAMS